MENASITTDVSRPVNAHDDEDDNGDDDKEAEMETAPPSDEPETKAPLSPTPTPTQRPWFVLPAIVLSQFAGTALWFAGNAVLDDLVDEWGLPESSLGVMTSSVQLGFIAGTLAFALYSVADRFLPTKVFLTCAVLGSAFNAIIPFLGWNVDETDNDNDANESSSSSSSSSSNLLLTGLIVLRFATGFFLAGIYPVGMKVAADHYQSGLGVALGWLVGALALGSSFPFLLRQIPQPWQALLWETSLIALLGGLTVGFIVPNGPYRKAGTKKFEPRALWTLFQNAPFRSAAFAYWGHMWELYAFWTWCPVVWEAYLEEERDNHNIDVPDFWSESMVTFFVIAIGAVGCILGGYASARYGSATVAFTALATSGSLCLLSPALYLAPFALALTAYLLWGMAVVADSPQFSTLVAQTAPANNVGTALTIVNCIGFAITIGSIQLLGVPWSEKYLFLLLAPGPLFGLWSLRKLVFVPSRLENLAATSRSKGKATPLGGGEEESGKHNNS